MKNHVYRLFGLLLIGMLAAACSSAPEAVPPTEAPAGDEPVESTVAPVEVVEESGTLTILCGMQEEWCQAAVAAFETETGIETEMVRMSSGEALARLKAEGADTQFDVWYGGPSLGPGAAVQDGLITAYAPENASAIPAELLDADGVWTGVYVGALGFCSNADLLADLSIDAPTSWDDLLAPELVDNIAMADQRTSGTAVTAGGALVALKDGEAGAFDYLRQLDINIFQYTKSGSAPGRMAAAGEVAVSVIFSHDCVSFAQETGANLIVSFPQEGTGYEIGQVSLIEAAKNPEAGKKFIEWTLTPAAQEIAASVSAFQIPTNPNANVPAEAVKLEEVILAEGFTPELVTELRANGFPDRFAAEVRGGIAAPGSEAAAPEPTPEPEVMAEEISGPLTVLCGMQEEWCQAAIAAFEAESGVETEMVRMSSGEALARLKAEGADTQFDVWYGGPSLGPGAAVQDGLVTPYIPAMGADIPAALKDADGNWTGVYVGALGFCSNAELLAELGIDAPTSWEDLLNPALVSNVAMADQRTSGTAVTAGGALVALKGGEEGAFDYLRQLDANIFQYTKSGSAPGRMTAAGEVAVSVIFSHDCVSFAQETGVDLVVSFPSEGTGYEIGQISLVTAAKNPAAGKAFIEWALTAAAQEVAATVDAYQIPTHPDAQVPAEAVKLDQVFLAEGFTPELVTELRANGFPDRFATEVRGGVAAPEG